ncbi:MAG: DUF5071 domain-containing protein [Patescibacteria group bacterium]
MIEILTGKDSTWKYWTLLIIVKNLDKQTSRELMNVLDKLAKHPTKEDLLEEIPELAKEILTAQE